MSGGHFISTLTNLGDSALTASLTCAMAAYLFFHREKRGALAILAAFAATSAIIAAGKIILYNNCLPFFASFGLRSPSGHSALSLAVYGTAAFLVSAALKRGWQALIFVALGCLSLAIGWSRVAIGAHAPIDVIVGLGVGLLVLLGVWISLLRHYRPQCRWHLMAPLAVLALLFGALHAVKLPSESLIQAIAAYLRRSYPFC